MNCHTIVESIPMPPFYKCVLALCIRLSSDLFNFINYSTLTKIDIIITVISSYSYKTNMKEK